MADVLNLPKLYGYASNGTVKVWSITLEENSDEYVVHHGKDGGKITSKGRKCKAKNVGKANETSPHEQAVLEAKAKHKKQIDKGYAESLDGAGVQENPMLAHDYRKQGHRIDYAHGDGVFVQPKLDGVRCLVSYSESEGLSFKSRGGKQYNVPKHLEKALKPIFLNHRNLVLDGELYIHGEYLQDIVACVKKENPLTEKLCFYVFDVPSVNASWVFRRANIERAKAMYTSDFVEWLVDFPVKSEEEVIEYHNGFVENGYEGVMVRQGHGMYAYNYRSPWLQKYKVFLDEEFTIVDVLEYENGLGKPVYETTNTANEKATFEAVLKGTEEEKRKLLQDKDKIIGLRGTVKYQALTKDGIPQFPVTVAIRDYE